MAAGVTSAAGPAWAVPARTIARPAAVADAKWDPLLCCVAGYMLMSVGRVHQLFPAVGLLRPAVLTGLGALLLYWMDARPERRARLLRVPTTVYLLALLCWMMLSVPGALVRGTSFDLVFDSFIKTVLMFIVVAGAVRGPRDVERLVVVYLISAVVYAAVVVTRFDLGSGDDWRLGHLYYYDANDFATFSVTAMPLALYFVHAGRRLRSRLLAAGALGILTLGFVWSGSRGGFVALVAMSAFIVVRYKSIALRWRLGATALVTLVLLGTASERYWQQMGTILSDADYNRTDESGRLQIWSRGIDYMMRNPVFGVGPNNFQAAEGMLSSFSDRQQFGVGVRWNAPHTSYLQAGVELGFPGLALFVLLIGSAFAALRRVGRWERLQRRHLSHPPQLAAPLAASLLAFSVGAFFLTLAYSEMLFTLIALAIGLHKVTSRRIPGGTNSP